MCDILRIPAQKAVGGNENELYRKQKGWCVA
jgi:hypothetical protein